MACSCCSRASLGSLAAARSPSRRAQAARPPLARASAAGDEASSNNIVPAATRYATRLEHMDTVVLHKAPGAVQNDLDLAENELASYCSRLDPDAHMERCWQAYSFLESKRERAQAGCDLQEPASCAELEKLNTMAHDLLATGSMDDLVATFSTLARVEEMRAARAAKQVEAAAHPAPAPAEEDNIHTLFLRMDTNKDGRLSMAEFRQAMAMLGDELDGGTVALIGDAMDVHGFLSEQQFRDIVEAERINSKSEVANLWRHHHLHPKHSMPRLTR